MDGKSEYLLRYVFYTDVFSFVLSSKTNLACSVLVLERPFWAKFANIVQFLLTFCKRASKTSFSGGLRAFSLQISLPAFANFAVLGNLVSPF